MNELNWLIAIAILVIILVFFSLPKKFYEKLTPYKKAGNSLYGAYTTQESWYKNYATPIERRMSQRFGRSWTNVNERDRFPDTDAGNIQWSSLIYGEIMNNDAMYNDDVLQNAKLLQGKNKLDPETRDKLCERPCKVLNQYLQNESSLCRCNYI